MSDEKTISLDEYERDNLLWLVRCAGRLHLNTGDWVYMVRAKLEAIGGNPDNANWPPSMTEAHVQGINDMRTALATAIAERDALAAEVESHTHIRRERADLIADRNRLTAECDALRGEVERLCGPEVVTMSRLQYEADGDQAAHYVAEQTAEAIAAWLDERWKQYRSTLSRDVVAALAYEIRSGSWRKGFV